MEDLLETDLFRHAKDRIISVTEKITKSNNVAIFATADLESIVS